MKIWLVRPGKTSLNEKHLMQGLTDAPLSARGLEQAMETREMIGDVRFDLVIASPLKRAVLTASIVSGVPEDQIIRDERVIETDFGKYEQRHGLLLGPAMSLYWMAPEVFPAPRTVETISSMTGRVRSFLADLREKDAENVLIGCHGGIMRVLSGCMEGRPNGIRWRPRPRNCEVRVYETTPEGYTLLEEMYVPKK